jgi:hypothetical protein
MKKFNWGHGIVATFIVFAVGTFIMVYIAVTTKVDLVTDDYYEKELRYQQQIDIMTETNELSERIEVAFLNDSVSIRYPKSAGDGPYRGTVSFFRPSDKSKDVSFDVMPDTSGVQVISIAELSSGLWRIKIAWNVDGREYFHEQPVIVQ